MEVYKQKNPPQIDLGKIKGVPIALFCGKYDAIAPLTDSEYTKRSLPAETVVFHKNYDYGHLSFWVAKDMAYIDDADKLIKQYL